MKKITLAIAATLAIIGLLSESGVINAAVVFLLTGAIPSTHYSIPPVAMFVLMAVGLWVLFALTSQGWIRKSIDSTHTKQLHSTVTLPRRRYGKVNPS